MNIKSKINRFKVFLHRNPFKITSIALTTVGFLLRIYSLSSPPLLDGEAITSTASEAIFKTGESILPSGFFYARAPLHLRLISGSYSLFGVNILAARLPSALAGSLSIPTVYFLGKHLKDKKTGLIASFFMTFSFISIAWSRIAREYALLQLFFLSAVFFYILFRERKKILYLALTGTFLVGTYYIKPIWVALPVIFLLDFIISNIDFKNNFEKSAIIVGLLGAVLGLIITIVLTQSPVLPEQIYDSIFSLVNRNFEGISLWTHPCSGDTPITFFSSYYPLLWFLFLIGNALVLVNKRISGKTLLISFWIPIFFLTYFGETMRFIWRPRYLLFLLPFFFLITSLAISEILSKLGKIFKQFIPIRRKIHFSLIIVVLMSALIFSPIIMDVGFKTEPNSLSQLEEPQPNYRDACNIVEKNMKPGDIIITNRPKQVYWWLRRVDYRANTNKLVYVENKPTDRDTGAKVLRDADELINLVENEKRVWIIWNRFMPPVGKTWIQNNLDLYGKISSTFASRYPHNLYPKALEKNHSDDEIVYIHTKGIGR